jgi:hypothetical protein
MGSTSPASRLRKRAHRHRRRRLRKAVALATAHAATHMCKTPCNTSIRTGKIFMRELHEGSEARFLRNLRMTKGTFKSILRRLVVEGGLRNGSDVNVDEQLAIFAYVVGQSSSNRNAQEMFQHSGDTISK